MEAVNREKLFNQIRESKDLLCALEQELENKDLLGDVYSNLYYEIKDGEINYQVDFYKDIKNGKLYNYSDLKSNPSLAVTKFTLYNINEDISLKFKGHLVATEHRVKQLPVSDYHEDKPAKIVPFDKTYQVGDLSHLMNIYPELFIFLTAYYNTNFDNLKDILSNGYTYKKEIK